MDTLDAFVLGLVQGLAEYLPISSSGHLEIIRQVLGLDLSGADSLQFDVVLHVATVLSTIVVLWRRFVPLCRDFFGCHTHSEGFAYVWKLLLSAVPVGIVGVCFKENVEAFFGGDLRLVGVCLCFTALLLSSAYFLRTNPLLRSNGAAYTPRDITWLDAIVIGCSQAVAVLPGLSRSGTTIATGIMIGDKRERVAEFSFFMVIIPILGEAILDVAKMMRGGGEAVMATVGATPMIVGFITAFVVGCLACRWMIDLVARGKLVWFALYCAAVGILCICI